MSAPPRQTRRKDYDVPTKLQLIHDDLDTLEADLEESRHETAEQLRRITQILTGILISITTTCIVLLLTQTLTK